MPPERDIHDIANGNRAMAYKDKRRFIRVHSLNLSYVLLDNEENSEQQTMGRTLDVSEAGIRLETHLPVEIGRRMLLSIGLENEVVDIRGRVVHSGKNAEGKYELGVEFTDKDAAASKTLRDFIRAFRQARGMEKPAGP